VNPTIGFALAGGLIWACAAYAGPGHPESLLRFAAPLDTEPEASADGSHPPPIRSQAVEPARRISVQAPVISLPHHPKDVRSAESSTKAGVQEPPPASPSHAESAVSAEEQPRSAASSLAHTMRRFSQLDTNADGRLDLPEFSRFESDTE